MKTHDDSVVYAPIIIEFQKKPSFTNKQKVAILGMMINALNEGRYFLCNAYIEAIIEALRIKRGEVREKIGLINCYNLFKDIPEILEYKPEKLYGQSVWFNIEESGVAKRLSILHSLRTKLSDNSFDSNDSTESCKCM